MSLHILASEASKLLGRVRDLNSTLQEFQSVLGVAALPRSDVRSGGHDMSSELLLDISGTHANVNEELEYAHETVRQLYDILAKLPEKAPAPTTHVMDESGASAGAGFVDQSQGYSR